MRNPIWSLESGQGSLVATAIHDGHALRDEVSELLALPEADRLREEDPFTGRWTAIATTRVIALRSRFEVDLNRAREQAVYRRPEDAWGLEVWREEPSDDLVARSLAEYDAFYGAMRELLDDIAQRHGRFVVLDLHSYNHRRGGPTAEPEPAADNPQVNVGTGSLDRARWGALVDRFIDDLSAYDFPGGRLDVRENVRFRGGNLSRWVHQTYPETGCALAVEFKKFFMDEWTGQPDETLLTAIADALHTTVAGLLAQLPRR